MTKSFANGRSIVHAGDGGVQTCPVPDVCKTPSPGGPPVTVPYVNVAKSSDLAKGTKKVKIEGKSVAIKGAHIKTSTGNEAGTAGGGLVSSKTKGKMKWASASADVKFEGKGVVRFLDVCLHNGNTDNTGGQPNTGSPGLSYGGDAPCPLCGAPQGHPLPSDEDTEAEIARLHETEPVSRPGDEYGYMIGAMKCKDSKGRVVMLTAHSGKPVGAKIPSLQNPGRFGKSLGGRKYKAEKVDGSSRPGNCAAPKLIFHARVKGLTPVALTESWHGRSPPSGAPFSHGNHAESCETCKDMLPAMLCPEPPGEEQ
ncbi:hypothetical protein ENSA5_19680 [Enhygromyxa salina]|uniref:Uncharacterized protein n=1 Tax=Enhygromyxa salina TaxID=215803 RepID=A0A2S9YD47_9BACT|nr:DUF4150 domain-containing protein [Enhygromyxa salina]PRQ03029.1 hypothetical protein ENSA5_19680 [Enhygromyxa salina]